MTTTTTTGGAPAPGATAASAAEWAKLWTLRSTRTAMAAAPVVAAAAAAVFCVTMAATTGVGPADRPAFDVVTTSLLGADAAAVVLLAASAASAGSEYATGMIRGTLAATPRRGRFLLGRAAAVGAATLGLGALSALAAFATGQFVLFSSGLPVAAPGDPQVVRAVAGAALMAPFYSLAATSLAVVARSTTGGVVGALSLLALPTLVSWGPVSWRGVLLACLPGEALHSLAGLTAPGAASPLPPVAAGAVLSAWTVLLLGAAWTALSRRDA
ncbi:ABC transporter [Actinorugispora endophytica]|uniref:ABC-2 type transport system permease protein n=1 Tax=Actinorugispora endophytica TaxID=1605990 RepID=A0A4R6UI48_9ACTN|nr:ABC transporter [Actinorugispora endophytica]TDQ45726.1 ABC-2 type transport system permease protein [Actinorugispora endophytica]